MCGLTLRLAFFPLIHLEKGRADKMASVEGEVEMK